MEPKTFIRKCYVCKNIVIPVRIGDTKSTCSICDTEHKIEWHPKTYLVVDAGTHSTNLTTRDIQIYN